jgi:hypothetical protein
MPSNNKIPQNEKAGSDQSDISSTITFTKLSPVQLYLRAWSPQINEIESKPFHMVLRKLPCFFGDPSEWFLLLEL